MDKSFEIFQLPSWVNKRVILSVCLRKFILKPYVTVKCILNPKQCLITCVIPLQSANNFNFVLLFWFDWTRGWKCHLNCQLSHTFWYSSIHLPESRIKVAATPRNILNLYKLPAIYIFKFVKFIIYIFFIIYSQIK